ncbi:DNA-binding protein [Avibacterium paragallinarum]|uniref:DNA-binding protein n=1 Tax=Avibacterium paragallinarum TaxID=728 RepID=UPI00397E31A8
MNSSQKQEWFTAYELEGHPDLPKKATNITRKATKENWIKRQIEGKRGVAFEYHYSSLPLKTQNELGFFPIFSEGANRPIAQSQDDLQKRIDQLENKLQALETKAQGFVSPKPPEGLTNDEWQLVCAFRRCNEDRQVGLLATAEALAAQTEKEQKESQTTVAVCAVA